MTLDVSGAEQLVRDFLRMSDDYRAHDSALSAELALKAQEISRDFDLDVESLGGKEPFGRRLPTEPSMRAEAAATVIERDRGRDSGRSAIDLETIEEQDQLFQILDHQKALLETQVDDENRPLTDRPRLKLPGWNFFGSKFGPQSA